MLQMMEEKENLKLADLKKITLQDFIKSAWDIVEQGTPYIHGWAIDAICEHLTAITKGDVKRMLINVPPGCMKSLLTCVFWPAWEWACQGLTHYRIISASHIEKLALRDNLKMRRLVVSDWYRRTFPHVELFKDQNAKGKFENTKMGFREACAFGGLTGSRGHRLILDDPLSVEDARSVKVLESTQDLFLESVPTRLIDPKTSAILVIMQRLHELDTSGVALSRDLGYTHLMLPMEFESDRKCTTFIGFEDSRKEDGELLFPERFPREVVERDKAALGIYATAGQFQQRPTPREGGIIELSWFDGRRFSYARLPEFQYKIQSWDTAFKVKQQNDFSVCGTFGVYNGDFYLLDVQRVKLKYPELKKLMIRKYIEHQPLAVLVEDKANGQSLIQEMEQVVMDPDDPKNKLKLPIKGMPANDDPVERVNATTTTIRTKLMLPDEAPWLQSYLDEMCAFPNGAHDDQVHMTAHAMLFLGKNNRPKIHNSNYFTR